MAEAMQEVNAPSKLPIMLCEKVCAAANVAFKGGILLLSIIWASACALTVAFGMWSSYSPLHQPVRLQIALSADLIHEDNLGWWHSLGLVLSCSRPTFMNDLADWIVLNGALLETVLIKSLSVVSTEPCELQDFYSMRTNLQNWSPTQKWWAVCRLRASDNKYHLDTETVFFLSCSFSKGMGLMS